MSRGTAAKRLYLLRHGDVGMSGRYCGSSDPPLSKAAAADLADTAAALRRLPIDEVLCSPLRRCRETLGLLELAAPSRTLTELREVDFGRWEGKSFAEIAASEPAQVAAWVDHESTFAFPDGEAIAAFRARMTVLARQLSRPEGRTRLVVSHGGVIRHLICSLLGLPMAQYHLFAVELASYSSLDCYPQGAVLTGLNLRGV